MNSNESQGKHVLFISELPDKIVDSELQDFFADYKNDIHMMQIDRNQKMYDLFNTRKPKATIIFKTHEKAEEARNKLNMRKLKGKALNIMWHERDNSIRYNNKANIFVKGISQNANPREIYELFAKYGEIISAKICENEDGDLLGYGYINYYNLESAENAIANLNKTKFKDSELEVEHFQKKNERLQVPQENTSIYIKNIPNSYSKIDGLKKIFSKFGKIDFAKVFQDSNERPYAIIVYSDAESANKAKEEMNDKQLDEKEEIKLYVDLLQKKSERKRMLTTKIGDINNKLNQEYKNCNLYIKNLPYDLTEEKLKEIFSACGEVKSVKIEKFILQTKIHNEFVEKEESKGFGYVCFTSEEAAKKAKDEYNNKTLPGFENSKRPIIINNFMPKNERKQMLNKIQTSQNQNYSYGMPGPIPGMPPYMYPPMFPRPMQNRQHKGNYRKPVQPSQQMQQQMQPPMQQISNQMPPSQGQNISNNKEDEPNLDYLKSLDNIEAQKDYLGEYLFKKIEQHPIAHSRSLTVDIISRITGMILGIGDIKEIYDITVNNEAITARINEALSLLDSQGQ
jgi:polyadenylate-binding protein